MTPKQVTLYTVTSQRVWSGTGTAPPNVEIFVVSAESEGLWFGENQAPSLASLGPRKITLPVYRSIVPVGRPANEDLIHPAPLPTNTEEHFFAIEPALKKMLEKPFELQLVMLQNELADQYDRCKKIESKLQRALNHQRALLQQEQQSVNRLNTSRGRLIDEIQAFKRAPLWRRLWVALFPERNWPRHY
jgi:hypothetical protein